MLCYNLVRKKMVTREGNREFLISLKGGSAKSYPMNHRFCTYILKKTMRPPKLSRGYAKEIAFQI